MTTEKKFDRLVSEVSAQPVYRRISSPWVVRPLWWLGIDVPSPLLWPFWVTGVVWGLLSGLLFFTVEHLPGWGYYGPLTAIISGVTIGFYTAIQQYYRSKRFKFYPWYESPDGVA